MKKTENRCRINNADILETEKRCKKHTECGCGISDTKHLGTENGCDINNKSKLLGNRKQIQKIQKLKMGVE